MADFSLPPPSPFLALPGEPPVLWSRWISSFETYILAAGLEGVSEGRRRALLLHCLGAEGQRVFGTLGTATTFTETVELLSRHFAAPQSALLRRTIFRRRYQRAGELVTQYVAHLRGLASLCKFGALQDEMVRDQPIVHTNCDKIRLLESGAGLICSWMRSKSVSPSHLAQLKCATTPRERRYQRGEHTFGVPVT